MGCAVEPNLGDLDQELRQPGDDGTGGCPTWGCGSNSPVIDAIEFYDVNEVGLPNAAGFSVTGFIAKDATNTFRAYRPDVLNGVLRARDPVTNELLGPNAVSMLGARFYMTRGGVNYELVITGIGSIPFWARSYVTAGVSPAATTYHLQWRYPTTPSGSSGLLHDVCGEPSSNDGIDPFFAVLFDDDRIDGDAKLVTGESKNWFNIGCAGHALAKQHLTGHTRAAATVLQFPIKPTLAERTANLKMITADYCGTGAVFTVPGMPLRWRDEYGWYNSISGTIGSVLEARWDETGATCLNEPRVNAHPTTETRHMFGNDIELQIMRYCHRPPACSGSWSSMGGMHVVSANPARTIFP